ncbi:MAG: hypothetical protein AAF499_05740 [Pseudomonadota bacterium]
MTGTDGEDPTLALESALASALQYGDDASDPTEAPSDASPGNRSTEQGAPRAGLVGDLSADDVAPADSNGDREAPSRSDMTLASGAETAPDSNAAPAETERLGAGVAEDDLASAAAPPATGWRAVAGRLLGRAKRVLFTSEAGQPDVAADRPKTKAKSTRAKTTRPRKPRASGTARKTPKTKAKGGLLSRLLAGVGLTAPAKAAPKKKRASAKARSAPSKLRTRQRERSAAPQGLFARTLARFGFAHQQVEPTVDDTPEDVQKADSTVPSTKPKATQRVKKTPTATPRRGKQAEKQTPSVWRRVIKRVIGRQ